jgi:hypothetical protein
MLSDRVHLCGQPCPSAPPVEGGNVANPDDVATMLRTVDAVATRLRGLLRNVRNVRNFLRGYGKPPKQHNTSALPMGGRRQLIRRCLYTSVLVALQLYPMRAVEAGGLPARGCHARHTAPRDMCCVNAPPPRSPGQRYESYERYDAGPQTRVVVGFGLSQRCRSIVVTSELHRAPAEWGARGRAFGDVRAGRCSR